MDCSGVFTIEFNTFGRGLLGTPPTPDPYLSVPGQVVTARFSGRDPARRSRAHCHFNRQRGSEASAASGSPGVAKERNMRRRRESQSIVLLVGGDSLDAQIWLPAPLQTM
jgi:hypothetical protein